MQAKSSVPFLKETLDMVKCGLWGKEDLQSRMQIERARRDFIAQRKSKMEAAKAKPAGDSA